MKALEKDRPRRYETANGFAEDVRRFVEGDAIEARPPSVGYRVKKFVKKNRGLVYAITAVIIGLVFGIVGSTSGYLRARVAELASRESAIIATAAEKKQCPLSN